MLYIELSLFLLSLSTAVYGGPSKCNCSQVICPSTHNCKVGLIPDVCGCCMICAYEEGASCHSNEECGSNLTCVFRRSSDNFHPGKCEQKLCVPKKCEPEQMCAIQNNEATCKCPECKSSPTTNDGVICDVTNNKQYDSECEFNKAECDQGKLLEMKRSPCDDGVSVNCGDDSMTITVDKNIISPNDMSTSFTLSDQNCLFQSNSTHMFIESKFNECGTKRKYTYTSVTYLNKVRGFHNSSPHIIRSNQLHIPIKCEYSFIMRKPKFPEYFLENKTQTSPGRRINIKSENEDSGEISVVIDPTKQYIVEFKTKRLLLSNGTIFPKFCYATPEAPSQRWMRYTLIKDSCVMEEGVSTFVHSNNTYRMFIPEIRFKGAEYSTITVKCKLLKCITDDIEICEDLHGCRKNRNKRKKRSIDRRNISKQTEYIIGRLPVVL